MALCPYFGSCGGCKYQDTPYEEQLDWKRNNLAQVLELNAEDIRVFSGHPWYYRNRMDLTFGPHKLGMREQGKWYAVVDIDMCLISNERINSLLTEVRNHLLGVDSFDLVQQTGTFHYAVIRAPRGNCSVSIVLNKDSCDLQEAVARVERYAEHSSADTVLVAYTHHKSDVSVSTEYRVLKGDGRLRERQGSFEFSFPVQGFFQTNSQMAEMMSEYVHNRLLARDTRGAELLDLYGGVGTFGISNASLFSHVHIAESNPAAIEEAKDNIATNNAGNVSTYVMDAKKLSWLKCGQPLFVIVDPPRQGMHPKTIKALRRMQPEHIIYVSCNPRQLGKELPSFKEYEMVSAALFDLFPHTPHAEAIVELKRHD